MRKYFLISTILLSVNLITSCGSNPAKDDSLPSSNTQIDKQNAVTEDNTATETDSTEYYATSKLVVTGDLNKLRCTAALVSPLRDCLIFAKVINNGNSPIDYYAETWAEDSLGRQYKGEGRYSNFEATLNPGMSSSVNFQFTLNPNVTLTKIYLVDVGGPVSATILSTEINLNSSN